MDATPQRDMSAPISIHGPVHAYAVASPETGAPAPRFGAPAIVAATLLGWHGFGPRLPARCMPVAESDGFAGPASPKP